MKEEFVDKHLGLVCVKRNVRARNIIARKKIGFIELTTPLNISMKQIVAVFEQMKPQLNSLKDKTQTTLNTESNIKTLSFTVKIENRPVRNFHSEMKDGILYIVCPDIKNFEDQMVQNTLRNVIEQNLRKEAKRIYPQILDKLAQLHGFEYKSLSINKSKTRWGSCSSTKSINLSYFTLFLPAHLVDFVMLHELCHTVEMNHGDRFWLLLNKVTNNKAKALTMELKRSTIEL